MELVSGAGCFTGLNLIAKAFVYSFYVESKETETINQPVKMFEMIAAIEVRRNYDFSALQPVQDTSCDNQLFLSLFYWEFDKPRAIRIGKSHTRIYDQITSSGVH